MKSRMFIAALMLTTLPLLAHASCDAVKSSIDAKIKANGVSHFSLTIVAADQADKSAGKVVGQCEGNKAIVYLRGQSRAADKNASGAPNDSSAGAATSAPATAAPGALPVAPPAPTRSGQTGG